VLDSACLFQQHCLRHNAVIRAPKGTTIIMPEQRVSYVYHLHEGLVGYYRTSAEGRDAVDHLVVPPHLIGMAGFAGMDRKEPVFHLAEARAITPVVYCKTKREAVWDLLDQRAVRSQIMDLICRTVFILTVPPPLSTDLAPRVLSILDALTRAIGTRDAKGRLVIPGITHEDIAAIAKATRPTVSRALERLQKRGIIEIARRNIVVLQPEALRQKPYA
jgi:CRP-like cAMP-binding protein